MKVKQTRKTQTDTLKHIVIYILNQTELKLKVKQTDRKRQTLKQRRQTHR